MVPWCWSWRPNVMMALRMPEPTVAFGLVSTWPARYLAFSSDASGSLTSQILLTTPPQPKMVPQTQLHKDPEA